LELSPGTLYLVSHGRNDASLKSEQFPLSRHYKKNFRRPGLNQHGAPSHGDLASTPYQFDYGTKLRKMGELVSEVGRVDILTEKIMWWLKIDESCDA